MIGAHQHLNGPHELTRHFQGWFAIIGLALAATINLSTKFEVSTSTHYKDMKGDTKCRTCGGLG